MATTENNKLQLYFDYFVEHHNPKSDVWYQSLRKYIEIIQSIRSELLKLEEFNTLEEEDQKSKLNEVFKMCSNSEINNIGLFLDRYLFAQDSGVGNVKQGVVWDTANNPHKAAIINNATVSVLYDILIAPDIKTADGLIAKLLGVGKNYNAVKNRFIRTIFPNDFGSPDAPEKLTRLTKIIEAKLGIKISGDNLEKHALLCSMIKTNDSALRQVFTWVLYFMLDSEMDLKKAIVYYGAPGTGKTFISDIKARQFIDLHRIKKGESISNNYIIQTVQFHPSFSYEDFFEGIRPTDDGHLKLFNGVFKQFCKDNGKLELNLYKTDNFLSNEGFRKIEYDFSQILISDLTDKQKEILGCNSDNVAAGLTIQDWIEPAFFIIDEINRAELSKVFGELMLSLEYRGYKGKIKTQYAHLCRSVTDESSFYFSDKQNWFFVPQNIYVIGTMNNIDRSVDAFDFALRRRFMWKEVHPNYGVIKSVLSEKGWSEETCKSLADSLKSLNDKIENDDVLDKNYRIGQSYILELRKMKPDRFDSEKKAKEFLWNNFIQPLLEEYLRGIGDEKKSNKKVKSFKKEFI